MQLLGKDLLLGPWCIMFQENCFVLSMACKQPDALTSTHQYINTKIRQYTDIGKEDTKTLQEDLTHSERGQMGPAGWHRDDVLWCHMYDVK
jgi:hypothetical protein